MGCGISAKKEIKVISTSSTQSAQNFTPQPRNNSIKKKTTGKVSQLSWLNIIDYLNYTDIKEVGKTNKMFNYLVRQNRVLIKFFKRKKTNRKNIKEENRKVALETFANLQKMKSEIFFNDSVFSTSIGDNELLQIYYYNKVFYANRLPTVFNY